MMHRLKSTWFAALYFFLAVMLFLPLGPLFARAAKPPVGGSGAPKADEAAVQKRRQIFAEEIESLNLCRPKRPIFHPNRSFKSTFSELGPNKQFTVALYAVNDSTPDKIMKWFDINRFSGFAPGMDMLPENFKLDSVRLMLR